MLLKRHLCSLSTEMLCSCIFLSCWVWIRNYGQIKYHIAVHLFQGKVLLDPPRRLFTDCHLMGCIGRRDIFLLSPQVMMRARSRGALKPFHTDGNGCDYLPRQEGGNQQRAMRLMLIMPIIAQLTLNYLPKWWRLKHSLKSLRTI